MKRFIKNNLKVFVAVVISAIVFGGIGVYAASQYFAKDITFTPTNENFKKENGELVDNVEDALNELYNNSNKKINGLGETFTINNYNGSRVNKTVSLELKKGDYVCNAIYGNAGENNKDYFGKSGQTITISDCDSYSELSTYSNVRAASGSWDNYHYIALILSGKSFSCKINNDKNIKITSNTSNDSATTYPVGIEVSCTKININ